MVDSSSSSRGACKDLYPSGLSPKANDSAERGFQSTPRWRGAMTKCMRRSLHGTDTYMVRTQSEPVNEQEKVGKDLLWLATFKETG